MRGVVRTGEDAIRVRERKGGRERAREREREREGGGDLRGGQMVGNKSDRMASLFVGSGGECTQDRGGDQANQRANVYRESL